MRGLAVALALAALAACGGESAEPEHPPVDLPPGNLLPEEIETYVFGGAQSCRADTDCGSGICYYGVCGGLLNVDTRWMQDAISDTLVHLGEGDPRLGERIVWNLARILVRPRTDAAFRARCVVGLERFGAAPQLREALTNKEVPESVQGAIALALSRLGDPAGLPLALALTEGTNVPVAAEALRALGTPGLRGNDDALVGLLQTLNADLDADLVRAAVDGLGGLGDPRAISPLVSFLPTAPDFIVIRAVRALRQLTGTVLGEDPAAWRAWVAAHPPPPPPKYTVRAYRTELDIGLPPP